MAVALGQLQSGGSVVRAMVAERYTEDTRRAIGYAGQEAKNRGSAVITVADLISGLAYEEDCRAQRIGRLKRNAFYLRWLIGLPQLPSRPPHEAAEPELDLDSRKALSCAVAEADRDRHYWIDTDHVLRGLLRFPNQADFALLKTEVTLHSLRVWSQRDRAEYPARRNPNAKVVRYLVGKYLSLWGPPVVSLACYVYILMQTIHFGFLPHGR